MAAPFVEGRLRNERLTVLIETKCADCDRPMRVSVDSDLHFDVEEKEARPLVFEPRLDWSSFHEPNIIGQY